MDTSKEVILSYMLPSLKEIIEIKQSRPGLLSASPAYKPSWLIPEYKQEEAKQEIYKPYMQYLRKFCLDVIIIFII